MGLACVPLLPELLACLCARSSGTRSLTTLSVRWTSSGLRQFESAWRSTTVLTPMWWLTQTLLASCRRNVARVMDAVVATVLAVAVVAFQDRQYSAYCASRSLGALVLYSSLLWCGRLLAHVILLVVLFCWCKGDTCLKYSAPSRVKTIVRGRIRTKITKILYSL